MVEEIICSRRGCSNQAISDKTKYCRSCQLQRVKSWQAKASGAVVIQDQAWVQKATEVNNRIMQKYANRWVVPRGVEQ